MADQLKTGDVVILKSGSPTMTIRKIGNYSGVQMADCDWFEKSTHHSGRFALDQLEKSNGPRV